jgi:hypothetical protein
MFWPHMVAIVRLYTLKLVNYYNIQTQFDFEISNTITFIGFTVRSNTVSCVDGRIILRRIFRKWDVGVWTGLGGSG